MPNLNSAGEAQNPNAKPTGWTPTGEGQASNGGGGWVEQGYSAPPGSNAGILAPVNEYNDVRDASILWATSPGNGQPNQQYTQNPYYLRALNQQLGFDPKAMEGLRSGINTMAGQAYEQGLAPLKRQQSMMGATGTGADMVANNALAAQISDQAMQQRQALELANMQQIERDLGGAASLALQGSQADQSLGTWEAQQQATFQQIYSEQWANIAINVDKWGKTTQEAAHQLYQAAWSQAAPLLSSLDPAARRQGQQIMALALTEMGMPLKDQQMFLEQMAAAAQGGPGSMAYQATSGYGY